MDELYQMPAVGTTGVFLKNLIKLNRLHKYITVIMIIAVLILSFK